MTKEEIDNAMWGCSEERRRARLLYCMDYIMHALNDEEAVALWLTLGVPDGTLQGSKEPPAEDYEGICETCEDFDEMVGVFINTLAREGGCRVSGKPHSEIGKAVLS